VKTTFRAVGAGLVLLSTAALAAPLRPVVAAQSALSFIGTQQGERFTGVFREFDARIEYTTGDLPGSRFEVTIPLKSLDSKSADRDQSLATADWFDFSHFPTATFRTVTMRATPNGVVADADLTIKGRTQRIAFPFTWKESATGATLDARLTLDRLTFGLGAGEWADDSTVGRKVEVVVHLTLGPAPVAAPTAAPQPRKPIKH
jgi:cytochrome b561